MAQGPAGLEGIAGTAIISVNFGLNLIIFNSTSVQCFSFLALDEILGEIFRFLFVLDRNFLGFCF